MKLPSAIKTGVQTLGRESPEAHLATGRAISGALQSVGSAVTDYQAKKTDSQDREARLAMSESMTAFESQYGGRDFISADEIPLDVEVRRTEKVTAEDGTIQELPRGDVPAYEVYPQLYKKFAESNAISAASLIDDENHRNNWVSDAKIKSNTGFTNRAITANARQEEFLQKQLTAQIGDAVADNNFVGAKTLAEDIPDDNLRAEVNKGIDRSREISYVDSLLLGGAETDGDLVMIEAEADRLRSDDYQGNLSESERAAKANSLDRASSEHEMALVERRKREDAQIVSDAWMSISRADPRTDENDVQQLFEDNLISGGEMTSMKRAIASNHARAMNSQATSIDLDAIANSPYGIDPKDKSGREQVNARFDEYVESSGDEGASAVKIMQEFKVVPDAVMAQFRSANRSDAAGLGTTAEMWNRAEDYAPQSLSDFKENEVDVIRKVAANIKLGMKTADAVEQVRRYDAMTPQQKSALKEQAKTIGENNAEALADMANSHESYKLPWGWVPFKQGSPDVPSFMSSEFNAKVDRYMPQVGYQLGVAQRMAFTDIAKQWQRTNVNGDWKLMKNAPQAPTDQIRSLVKKQYGKKDGIVITSDQLTQAQLDNGKPVSYQAFEVVDPDTQEIKILERFQWDAKGAAEARRTDILKQGQLERTLRRHTPKSAILHGGIEK